MTIRVYKTEKFVGRNGETVFQIWEEMESNGRVSDLGPRNPSQQELQEANDAFNAAQQLVIDQLLSDKTSLQSQVATLTNEKTALQSQFDAVSTSNTEKDATISELQSQLDAANATIAERDARIESLLTELPFDPRIITADAFYDRLTPGELFVLMSSTDPVIIQIKETIVAYRNESWRVELDSIELQQMVGYLLQAEKITPERAAELRRDGVRSEAYFPPDET